MSTLKSVLIMPTTETKEAIEFVKLYMTKDKVVGRRVGLNLIVGLASRLSALEINLT
jgi:hypothetical protein